MLVVDASHRFTSDLNIMKGEKKFMNGSNGSGIVPTVDLATNNNNGYAYPYPVMPMMGGFGGYGNNGFFGGDGIWILILFALLFGNGGWGNGNGFFGGNSFDNGFAWLSNGQKEIMNNTNNGFDTLHLSNQIEGVRDGVYGLSNQMCNSTSDIVQAVNTGFSSAEISNNARQIANMQQSFNNQISTLQGFNGLERQLCDCCCENRLATQDLKATVISENCADREALSNGIRDIITNQNNAVQRVLDQLCQDKIDSKNEKITDLQREILMKDLQASQVAQTAQLRAGQETANTELLNLLNTCPIPCTPVYGRTPIFTCNNGYGCSGLNTTSQFI